MPKHSDAQTEVVSIRLTVGEARALRELARSEFAGSLSSLLRSLLAEQGGLSGLGKSDSGYNAGLRQGVHEARTAITAALKKKWRA